VRRILLLHQRISENRQNFWGGHGATQGRDRRGGAYSQLSPFPVGALPQCGADPRVRPRSARVPLDPPLAPSRNLKTEQLVRKISCFPFICNKNCPPTEQVVRFLGRMHE